MIQKYREEKWRAEKTNIFSQVPNCHEVTKTPGSTEILCAPLCLRGLVAKK